MMIAPWYHQHRIHPPKSWVVFGFLVLGVWTSTSFYICHTGTKYQGTPWYQGHPTERLNTQNNDISACRSFFSVAFGTDILHIKIQPKFSQNSAEVQPKFSQCSAKVQSYQIKNSVPNARYGAMLATMIIDIYEI